MTQPSRPSARFEFRAFFAPASAPSLRLPGFDPLEPEQRMDIYLLPPGRPDVLPKLRGGTRFEVKRRLACDRPPIERWTLAISCKFPLDSEARRTAAALFGLSRDDEAAFAGPEPVLAAVRLQAPATLVADLTKHRERWRRGDLVAERTELAAGGRRFVSIGFESGDATALLALLRSEHLLGADNTDYGRFLRAICRP